MRLGHFELLAPVCPVCRSQLGLVKVADQKDDIVVSGILQCENANCLHEYPIIDGVPIIVRELRNYLAQNQAYITARDDLPECINGILGDGLGEGTAFNNARQQLSCYCWDHYGDLDPVETQRDPSPGAISRMLESVVLQLTFDKNDTESNLAILDVGCSVGRGTLDLAARFDAPSLGIDVNFPMLRLAQQVLRFGEVRYPRRRVGLVYDERTFPVPLPSRQHVDYWCCDATALPLAPRRFELVVGLNVLDCVASPLDFLKQTELMMRPGGRLVLSCPYDWSANATPTEAWIGGHSRRGDSQGASEPVLRSLVTPGMHQQSIEDLHIDREIENVPWHVRMHDRSYVAYSVHMIVASKTQTDAIHRE